MNVVDMDRLKQGEVNLGVRLIVLRVMGMLLTWTIP